MLCQIIVSDQIVQDLTGEIMFYPLRPYCASLQEMDMDLLKVEYRSLMIYSEAKGVRSAKGPL